MLEGNCPKCGAHYCGWALGLPRNQMCGTCGSALEITQDGRKIASGYSLFDAEEYIIQYPTTPKIDAKKDTNSKRKDSL